MEDIQIVELYWNRDESAITETREKYGNYCYSIAYRILHNNEDVEESLNDSYLATWNAIPPHHPLNLATFIGKITRRISLDRYRALSADKRGGGEISLSLDELEGCIPDDRSIRDSLSDELISDTINDFLASLKESERKVFVCRYWYFETIEEIAQRFAFSPSKVKMILKRNRDKLKQQLLQEGIIV